LRRNIALRTDEITPRRRFAVASPTRDFGVRRKFFSLTRKFFLAAAMPRRARAMHLFGMRER